MTNSTGFTPAITRYLNSVKGKKRQELVNQISQLSSKDLEQLEMNLIQKYEDESEMESINKMGKQAYMDLYDMNEGQYEKRFGGRMYQQGGYMLNDRQYNPMQYFQEGGAYYGGDDSAEYLEQVYNQQAQTNQPMVSPTGVVMTPEMQQDLMMQNQVVPVNGFRPNQQTYTPQEAASLYQQGVIQRPANYVEQVPVQSPVVYHIDPNKANQTDKAVAKEAEKVLSERESVKRIQEELYNRGLLKGDKSKVIDGIFGKKTEAAVKAAQEQLGLKSDGIVGAKTKVALGITDLGRNTYKSNIVKQVESARKMNIPVAIERTEAEDLEMGKRNLGSDFIKTPNIGQNVNYSSVVNNPINAIEPVKVKNYYGESLYNDNITDLIKNKKGDYTVDNNLIKGTIGDDSYYKNINQSTQKTWDLSKRGNAKPSDNFVKIGSVNEQFGSDLVFDKVNKIFLIRNNNGKYNKPDSTTVKRIVENTGFKIK